MKILRSTLLLLLLISTLLAQTNIKSGKITSGKTAVVIVNTAFITTNPVTQSARSDITGCVGFRFQASSAITVRELGRWKISGNTGTHTIHLFDTVTSTDIATVSINTTTGSAGSYIYANVSSPPTLVSGRSYIVASAETNAGDQWYNQEDYSSTGVGSLQAAVFSTDGSCTAYSDGATVTKSYVPTNFKY